MNVESKNQTNHPQLERFNVYQFFIQSLLWKQIRWRIYFLFLFISFSFFKIETLYLKWQNGFPFRQNHVLQNQNEIKFVMIFGKIELTFKLPLNFIPRSMSNFPFYLPQLLFQFFFLNPTPSNGFYCPVYWKGFWLYMQFVIILLNNIYFKKILSSLIYKLFKKLYKNEKKLIYTLILSHRWKSERFEKGHS